MWLVFILGLLHLYPKLLPLFIVSDKGQESQVDISSVPEELASPSSSSSEVVASSTSSSEAVGGGGGEASRVRPPMTAYRSAIWLTRMFT